MPINTKNDREKYKQTETGQTGQTDVEIVRCLQVVYVLKYYYSISTYQQTTKHNSPVSISEPATLTERLNLKKIITKQTHML